MAVVRAGSPRRSGVLPVLAGLAALALLAAPAAAKAPAFPVTEQTLYLSGETGSAAGRSGVLLLTADAPSSQAQETFVLPGLNLLGVVDQAASQTWFSSEPWGEDLEVVDDATVLLHFAANAQASAVFSVALFDVASDGQADLLAFEERQFVSVGPGQAVEFRLAIAGTTLPQGHVLALEVAAETANAVVVMEYGGATPSALQDLRTRWLDSDGDGMGDSRERSLGRNPFAAETAAPAADDADGDGLAQSAEEALGTDAADEDTDGDGWGDGLETYAGTDPLDAESTPPDADGDGLPDAFEDAYFGGADAAPGDDPDEDGCPNLCEARHGIHPLAADTDGDGAEDGAEVEDGTDPANAASVLRGNRPPEPVLAAAFFAVSSTLCFVPLLRRP